MNLYEKLLEIQKAVPVVKKDGLNQSDKYKYASGVEVLNTIRPKMDELGLLLIPATAETFVHEGQTKSGTARFLTEINWAFTWHDVESGEELTVPFYSQGADLGGERGVGKAATYAEKVFLLKFFHVATADDPDNDGRTKAGEKAVRGTAAEAENIELYKAAIPAMLNELSGGDEEKIKASYIALTKNDKRGYAGVDSLERITNNALPIVYGKLVKQYEKRTGHAFELPKEDDPE